MIPSCPSVNPFSFVSNSCLSNLWAPSSNTARVSGSISSYVPGWCPYAWTPGQISHNYQSKSSATVFNGNNLICLIRSQKCIQEEIPRRQDECTINWLAQYTDWMGKQEQVSFQMLEIIETDPGMQIPDLSKLCQQGAWGSTSKSGGNY